MEAYPVLRDLTDEEILSVNSDNLWERRRGRDMELLIYLLKRYRWDKIYDKKKVHEIIDAIG